MRLCANDIKVLTCWNSHSVLYGVLNTHILSDLQKLGFQQVLDSG